MPKINTPPFDKYPLVSNERITLRQPVESDLNDLMEISFYNAVQATTLEQAVEMNQKINQDYNNGNSIHWTIVEKQSGKLVGTCGYYRDRKSTRLNSSHVKISYAVFCLKKKIMQIYHH